MDNKIENKKLLEKWDFLLSDPMLPEIKSQERRIVTAQLLENTTHAIDNGMMESVGNYLTEAAPSTNTSGVTNYDPVLISMIRRSAPKLIAYDIVGVQPLSGPTGQIFAMRSRYSNQTGAEAFFNEANTGFSTIRGGNNVVVGDANLNIGTTANLAATANAELFNFAGGMTLAQAEALGTSGNAAWREMSVSIEKILVEAKSRALKAEYTQEFAQDLKAIHGLDAHKELANVLSTELITEINREIVRTVYLTAVTGSPSSRVTTAGIIDLDTDTNGRWMGERFEGLVFHTQLEANDLAKATRRGKANIMICSSNVASALTMAKVLDASPAASLQIDDTGNTFAGVMNGIRVYIDPYADRDYAVLGFKGQSSWDAGLFYCPYTPLQMTRALDDNSMTPKIGFKTRYGVVANPFSKGTATSNGSLEINANVYYRRSLINNLM